MIFVADTFTRTNGSSWGTADTGGAYTHGRYFTGTGTWSTNGAEGVYSSGTASDAWLMSSTSVADFDALWVMGAGYEFDYTGILFREYNDSFYGALFELTPPTGLDLQLLRGDPDNPGSFINPAIATDSYSGDWTLWWCRVRVEGTNIKVKAWRTDGPEPESWLLDVTDSTLTDASPVGIFASSTHTNSLTMDDLVVQSLAGAPTWVSPADTASAAPGDALVWTSLAATKRAHFKLQIASDSGFSSGLSTYYSYADSGFEYWDGSAWQALGAAGMPSNKTGNNVRYTATSGLSGTKYRRVAQTV